MLSRYPFACAFAQRLSIVRIGSTTTLQAFNHLSFHSLAQVFFWQYHDSSLTHAYTWHLQTSKDSYIKERYFNFESPRIHFLSETKTSFVFDSFANINQEFKNANFSPS